MITSYDAPTIPPFEEKGEWFFIWNHVLFGPYVDCAEAWLQIGNAQHHKEADSCSEAYRHE